MSGRFASELGPERLSSSLNSHGFEYGFYDVMTFHAWLELEGEHVPACLLFDVYPHWRQKSRNGLERIWMTDAYTKHLMMPIPFPFHSRRLTIAPKSTAYRPGLFWSSTAAYNSNLGRFHFATMHHCHREEIHSSKY